ncbi:ATP-binding cassette domain-containing protein [Gammaproteobacteria bacterium AS21]
MSALTITDVSIYLTDKPLLSALSFSVNEGEVLSIMGPSGCGKSTLLNFLCGTLPATFRASGEVRLNNKSLTRLAVEQRKVGILYQSPLLFPHMNNLENLMFAIPARIKGKQRQALALDKLSQFNLADKALSTPQHLSGGQQARIALLRTLLSEPEYLLLDEPFGKLDSTLRQSVREFVLEQVQISKLPTILVTHDTEDCQAMGNNVLHLA